ncbi:hypothetical protein FMEAI12_5420010 [Parafrankia sp. Ea1.12]|nr:hypothetical protein FMEAI12_5420010 [Parafrankia sp. Ea1.12]
MRRSAAVPRIVRSPFRQFCRGPGDAGGECFDGTHPGVTCALPGTARSDQPGSRPPDQPAPWVSRTVTGEGRRSTKAGHRCWMRCRAQQRNLTEAPQLDAYQAPHEHSGVVPIRAPDWGGRRERAAHPRKADQEQAFDSTGTLERAGAGELAPVVGRARTVGPARAAGPA